jgi:phosphoglucomutase
VIVKDSNTGFFLLDSDKKPFQGNSLPENFSEAIDALILSASGWRKVYADSEHSQAPEISDQDKLQTALSAFTFHKFLSEKLGKTKLTIALGCDSRPTGTAIAEMIIRILLSQGCAVQFIFIAAAPEMMSYSLKEEIDGFIYVSASHNPLGHNGLKMGFGNGGVLPGTDANVVIEQFKKNSKDTQLLHSIIEAVNSVDEKKLLECYEKLKANKAESLKLYEDFSRKVISGYSAKEDQDRIFSKLNTEGIGIVCDMNGSARILSIDKKFFEAFGFSFSCIHDTTRMVAHGIIPEGENLNDTRAKLTELNKKKGPVDYILGYMPDNDGDRGNIVYFDKEKGKSIILQAQDVFALSVIAELSYLVYSGLLPYDENKKAKIRAAVVVNGPTSLRIDHIAKAFDVKVFRAEVGEANVVNLARELRESGYLVRILGEGSNGGNITHPAAVRDPLNTVMAFAKLLLIKDEEDRSQLGLYHIACERLGVAYAPDYSMPELVSLIPQFTTTETSDKRAILPIKSDDHGALKAAYERIFPTSWELIRNKLEKELGVQFARIINYEGTSEKHGTGSAYRSGRERGGFKILFKDGDGTAKAFVWMRGSGTEPVFRVLADVEGNRPDLEQYLLEWHRQTIMRADLEAYTN